MNKPRISRFFWFIAFGYLFTAYFFLQLKPWDIPIILIIMLIAGILDILGY